MAERKVIFFEKKRRGLRSQMEKVGVKPVSKKTNKKLLVIGTGRCGTTWIYKVLKKIGMKLGHEYVAEDGTVSWHFQKDSDWYPYRPWENPVKRYAHYGERRSDYEFDHTIHLVRHPLKVIPSMAKVFGELEFEFMEDNGLVPMDTEPRMLRCMHAYLNMNLNCETQTKHRFRVEDFKKDPAVWKKLLKTIDVPLVDMPELPPANRARGYRAPEEVTWEDLAELDAGLTAKIKKMAKRYGYDV